jgi:AraC-like DNA-binding protein
MTQAKNYIVNAGWRIMLRDLGVNAINVLRRAGLPDDLFAREGAMLTTEEYFGLWRALEEEAADPLLPLRLGSAIPVEAFDPPIFAALCSPDLNTALDRLSRYKRLIGPMALPVEKGDKAITLELRWLDSTIEPPVYLVATELVFFTQLARLATREKIRPLKVTTTRPPSPAKDYTSYFGVEVRRGTRHAITFSAKDARRPFLTANEKMWQFFEPSLQKRLSELEEKASLSDRVRAALLEMLPGGSASMNAVSSKLRTSSRTLQRRLSAEGGSFQRVLDQTREELARHYLGKTAMSGAEISFMLGYEDPNSFFRAFHKWTGQTPERVRESLRVGN